jgi:two-component system NtrC family sensor kinase
VAVADLNENAPGYLMAKERGLMVTRDYNDFFKDEKIELIIELTGSMDLYNDILRKKGRNVRAISSPTAQLFWELARVSNMQKKTKQELVETNARYQAVFNQLVQEEVLVIGFDHRILDANEKLLRNLDLTREEVIGRYCYDVTHHQDTPCSGDQHPCPLIQTKKTKEPFRTTHVHKDREGNEIHYSIATYPLMEDGEIIGAIEVSRDITRDINRQKSLMNQEKLVSVGRLSAGVAHEINNPLTTILTTAMLLQEDLEKDNPLNEELTVITNEALRCRKIVTSLLNFARQTEPERKLHNINNIIKESISLTRKQAAFKDIMVHHDLFEELPEFLVDKGQIEQVIINLILNAVEATEPGDEILVSTGCSKDAQVAEIYVSDNGSGISQKHLDKIFDPFFTTKEHGTGLGLDITHGIIEQHDGMIAVESKEGKGTTFLVRIPFDGKQ